MARSGMTALIARLRLMIDDGPSPQRFSDDILQDILDTHRVRLPGHPLKADWQEAPPPRAEQLGFYEPTVWVGYQERKVWRSDWPYLDGDCEVRDASGAVISNTLYNANLFGGTFTFTLAQDAINYLWGYAYDLNGAAADAWTLKQSNASLWKGQTIYGINEVIKNYRRLAWGVNGTQTRV